MPRASVAVAPLERVSVRTPLSKLAESLSLIDTSASMRWALPANSGLAPLLDSVRSGPKSPSTGLAWRARLAPLPKICWMTSKVLLPPLALVA